MRLWALVVSLILLAVATAEDKPAIRKLDLKDVSLEHDGLNPKPAIATSEAELAKIKAFLNDTSRDAVKKQVDFAKEKVVVFAWSGSGRDRLAPGLTDVGGKVVAEFNYSPGSTDDLRKHGFVFAVPKDATVKVK